MTVHVCPIKDIQCCPPYCEFCHHSKPVLAAMVINIRGKSDLAAVLRGLAERADRGEIVDFVCAFENIPTEEYEFSYAASMTASLVLATLLQSQCIQRIHE